MSFSIFISHANRDMEHVNAIKIHLEHLGFRVFITEDSLYGGQFLSKNIMKEICACDIFIVVWSKNADISRWVRVEIGQAIAKHKIIIPVILNDRHSLPEAIGSVVHVDITQDNLYLNRLKLAIKKHKASKIRKSIITAAVLAFIFVIGLFSIFRYASSTRPEDSNSVIVNPPPPTTPRDPNLLDYDEIDRVLTNKELTKYRKNKTLEEYKFREVLWGAIVVDFESTKDGDILTFKPVDSKRVFSNEMRAKCDIESRYILNNLSKGDVVLIYGVFNWTGDTSIEDCMISNLKSKFIFRIPVTHTVISLLKLNHCCPR